MIGMPVANRVHPATEDDARLLRQHAAAARSRGWRATRSASCSRSVRDAALAAQANQDVPFQAIVEAVNPPRHPGRNPCSRCRSSGRTRRSRALDFRGLEVETVTVHPPAARRWI